MSARQIDDAQSPVAQCGPFVPVKSAVIRTAMLDRVRHAFQQDWITAKRPGVYKSSDSTHTFNSIDIPNELR